MSAEDFDTLLKMVNRWKALLLLLSVAVPVLSSFQLGYGWHVHFSVCPSQNLSHEIFPLFCVLFVLHSSMDAGYIYIYIYILFYENFWWLFYMTYLTNVCKRTHFIQLNVFITCTVLTPNTWLSTHLTSSAHEMSIILCDSPVNTDIIFSCTLRAQMLRTVLVFINRWRESVRPASLLNVVWPWFCSTVADGVWFEIRRMRKA